MNAVPATDPLRAAERAEFLLDEIMSEVVAACGDLGRGADSLCRMTVIFLDANLQQPQLQDLLRDLGGTVCGRGMRRSQQARWSALSRAEMDAAGVIQSALPARMAGALMMEVLAAEALQGQPLPESRERLLHYLRQVLKPTDPTAAAARVP